MIYSFWILLDVDTFGWLANKLTGRLG